MQGYVSLAILMVIAYLVFGAWRLRRKRYLPGLADFSKRWGVRRPRLSGAEFENVLLIFIAAGASVLVSESLGLSLATNLLNTIWILAPYLVLGAVMVFVERRTSLVATAITAFFGAVGALTPVAILMLVESDVATRLVPIYQAVAVAVLVPACKRLIAEIEVKPPATS